MISRSTHGEQFVTEAIEDAAIGVGVASRPEDLKAIRSPGIAAAIWRREMRPEFQEWIVSLNPDHLPSARIILQSETV